MSAATRLKVLSAFDISGLSNLILPKKFEITFILSSKVFLDNSSGKIWSSLRRIGREWTCEAVGPTVEKQLPSLINKSKSLINSSLRLLMS